MNWSQLEVLKTNANYEDRDKNITKPSMTCGFQAFKFTQCTVHYLLTLSSSSLWLHLIGKVAFCPWMPSCKQRKLPKGPQESRSHHWIGSLAVAPFVTQKFIVSKQFCRCFKTLNQKQVSGLVSKEIQPFAKVLSEILVIATPLSPILTSYSLTISPEWEWWDSAEHFRMFAGWRDLMTLDKIIVTFGCSFPEQHDLKQHEYRSCVVI